MSKTILHLWVDDEEVQLAKTKGINLSSLFREVLATEFQLKEQAGNKKDQLALLKSKVSILSAELKAKLSEIRKLKKENVKLNEKLAKKEVDNETSKIVWRGEI